MMTERELYLAPGDDEQTEQALSPEERGDVRQTQPESFEERYSAHLSSGGTVNRGYKLMFFDLGEA
jgi:hypothetical protein